MVGALLFLSAREVPSGEQRATTQLRRLRPDIPDVFSTRKAESGERKLAAVVKPQLCACESGLTAERCCVLDLSRLNASDAQRHLQPLEERAAQARTEGATDEAERLALDVLELAPGRVPALTVLYELRKSQGRSKAAVALIRRIVALAPNNFWATNEATVLLDRKSVV